MSQNPNVAETKPQRVARCLLAGVFVAAGAWHFIRPGFYRSIVPPGFGPPAVMVAVSGAAEIAGGVGLLVPALRRPAGWGLVALLFAIFPANIYMVIGRGKIPGDNFPLWALWTRLPLQIVLIAWAAWAGGIIRRRRGL